jgi:DNA-binding HxlR family transcriptional regulator
MNPLDDQICVEAIRKVMDIFGGKWTFVIMGELHAGKQQFNSLNRKLGISTKSLADCLKKLEANGVVTRTVHPTSPVTVDYTLTEKGMDFQKVFNEMREWGVKWF